MHARRVNSLCLAALLTARSCGRWIMDFRIRLRLLVRSGTGIAGFSATPSAGHRWILCFGTIALLFDPVASSFSLVNRLGVFTILLTAASSAALWPTRKPQPLPSRPFITDHDPDSESL